MLNLYEIYVKYLVLTSNPFPKSAAGSDPVHLVSDI